MDVHKAERVYTYYTIGNGVVERAAEKIDERPCRCHADFTELCSIVLMQKVNQSVTVAFINVNHFCV